MNHQNHQTPKPVFGESCCSRIVWPRSLVMCFCKNFYVPHCNLFQAKTKILWVVPPPRIPVTTRIITFLVGNPYKPSFPLLLGGGTTQKILNKQTKSLQTNLIKSILWPFQFHPKIFHPIPHKWPAWPPFSKKQPALYGLLDIHFLWSLIAFQFNSFPARPGAPGIAVDKNWTNIFMNQCNSRCYCLQKT